MLQKGIFSLLLGGLIGISMIKYDIYNNLQGPKMYLVGWQQTEMYFNVLN